MITIDVSEVGDDRSLHLLLARELDFPEFYGMNWDAFWDAITGLVSIPDRVRFLGWDRLAAGVPGGGRHASPGAGRLPSQVPPGVRR
ncbi:barstar family protein [Streptomyces sp. NPDC004592]